MLLTSRSLQPAAMLGFKSFLSTAWPLRSASRPLPAAQCRRQLASNPLAAVVGKTSADTILVGSLGSVMLRSGKITTGTLGNEGYKVVDLDWRQRSFLIGVHRLVAWAHHPVPANVEARIVNHIDGQRSNNCKDNLEFVTPSENAKDSYLRCPDRKGYSGRTEASTNHIPTLPGEIWAEALHPVTGQVIENYSVSTLGRVQRTRRERSARETPLQGTVRSSGVAVIFRVNGKSVEFRVHRVVLRTFAAPPPYTNWQAMHLDGDKTNNALSNLAYCTPSEKVLSVFKNTVRSSKHGNSKAVMIRSLGALTWTLYSSIKVASEALGVNRDGLSMCCNGKRASTGGYEAFFESPPRSGWKPGEIVKPLSLDKFFKESRRA